MNLITREKIRTKQRCANQNSTAEEPCALIQNRSVMHLHNSDDVTKGALQLGYYNALKAQQL